MAQTGTSTITGIVRDSSGGAIPGATVRVVNEDTGVTVEAVTDEQGAYRAAALAPGQYRVETALDGFETAVRRIALEAGQTADDRRDADARRDSPKAVVVTARRVEEVAQEVPIPVSVVSGDLVADAGAFNVNRLKEMIPTVQFYSTNPRNSAINIRGLGAPFGLTNDGIEPGVGLYIDGVFYARPAVGDARLPRRRAGRGAARTAGHALRQEHDRRRHQRHDPQAQLHAGHRLRAQLRQPRIRSGEGVDHRARSAAEGRRAAVLLRHAA